MVIFTFYPNLIKKILEQLNILRGGYDGHFFAQRYFGSQSLHEKKNLAIFCAEMVRNVTFIFAMKIENAFLPN